MLAHLATLKTSAQSAASDASAALFGAIVFAAAAVMIAALWRIYAKAGRPGWASLIPIYNLIVLCRIIGRPWWYAGFAIFPPTAAVLAVIVCFGLSRSFGKGWPFAIGMLLMPFVFLLVLAFGGSTYLGPLGPSYRGGPAIPRQV